jgi:biotin--protein ligase
MEEKAKRKKEKVIQSLMRCLFFIIVSIGLFNGCKGKPNKNADIALYAGQSCWQESALAFKKMSEWMGYKVRFVDSDYINKVGLDSFKIMCIPGVNLPQYAQSISLEGRENIKKFIHDGGAYIGICGGATFAGEKAIWQGEQLSIELLGLYKGTSRAPIDEIVALPGYGMSKVNIVDFTHPIAQSEVDSIWVFYYGSPSLLPDQDENIAILGRYDVENLPMMLAFEYGHGRVFLIGAHPELEVNSYRDGTAPYDELDDKGSDWDSMKKVILWCLKELN